jgi:hypothetical protein
MRSGHKMSMATRIKMSESQKRRLAGLPKRARGAYLSAADRDAIRKVLKEARAHIIDGPEPPSWSSEVVAKLTAALALIGEG